MRSKVVFEYLRAAAGLRFSVRRRSRQKSRHAGMLSVNLYPVCETRAKKKTGHSHFRHVARVYRRRYYGNTSVIIVMSKYSSSLFRSRENLTASARSCNRFVIDSVRNAITRLKSDAYKFANRCYPASYNASRNGVRGKCRYAQMFTIRASRATNRNINES